MYHYSIFVQPVYCGVHSDISLMLNRCRDDKEYTRIIQEVNTIFNQLHKYRFRTDSSSSNR